MKECQFNRMRIHIHRKDKKSKWLDLPTRAHQDNADIDTMDREYDPPVEKRKEFKTAFARRRLIAPPVHRDKIKDNSSSRSLIRDISSPAKMRSGEAKPKTLEGDPSYQKVGKLDKLLNDSILRT
jgi:hypothetical protein